MYPNIAWSEKGELKYKGETIRGSNVVDLVNDVEIHHSDEKNTEISQTTTESN
jgi:hypothetical protein